MEERRTLENFIKHETTMATMEEQRGQTQGGGSKMDEELTPQIDAELVKEMILLNRARQKRSMRDAPRVSTRLVAWH